MGNCIDIQKPVCWADDEVDDASGEDQWETRSPSRGQHQTRKKKVVAISDETNPLSSRDDREIREAAVPISEIKIKIGKKRLEKLLRQADGEGLPLQQVLLNLVSVEESYRIDHVVDQEEEEEGGHWKPNLHSIPEIAE